MRDVLVIDDDPLAIRLVERLLVSQGYTVRTALNAADGLKEARGSFRGVVVLDLVLPDLPGVEVLEHLRHDRPDLPVIILTGRGSTDVAVGTLRSGSFEYLDKEHIAYRLIPAVQAAMEVSAGARDDQGCHGLVGSSPPMRRLYAEIEQAAGTRLPVLIRGESGTGKELAARAIHRLSRASAGPFVAVNTAAVPDTLLESELFGHERGAFTGAHQSREGRFGQATGGTLFLDEIGDMPIALQAKLLRVLQEGSYQRVGGSKTLHTDARIISATHRDLEASVQNGCFREDLMFRIAVFTVDVPPLRERPDDIPVLVEHFIAEAAAAEGKPITDIDSRALEILCAHKYPGNVRELENIVRSAVVRARGPVVTLGSLPERVLRSPAVAAAVLAEEPEVTSPEGGRFLTLAELERQHIEAALRRVNGNKTLAAKLLGMSRMTLYRRLEAGDIPIDE